MSLHWTLRRWRARWRLWWNRCPECNCDAPEKVHCEVCRNYCPSFDGWPPEKQTLANWQQRWEELEQMRINRQVK